MKNCGNDGNGNTNGRTVEDKSKYKVQQVLEANVIEKSGYRLRKSLLPGITWYYNYHPDNKQLSS